MPKLPPRHARGAWFTRLPLGVREQPAWIFIGVLLSLGGFGYASGTADSTAVTKAIGAGGMQIWGGFMMASGLLLIVATSMARPSLEKLALRLVSSTMLAYLGWVIVTVPFAKAATVVILCGALVALSEFRVMHLRALMKRTEIIRHELKRRD